MTPDEAPEGPLLVDTGVFSWMAHRRGRHQEFWPLLQGRVLALSFAVVGELRAGAKIARWGPERIVDLERRIRMHVVLPFTDAVVDRWSEIYARFRDQLDVNDMWTAACALAQPSYSPSSQTTSATSAPCLMSSASR